MSSVEPLVRSFKRQRCAQNLLLKYEALSVFLDQQYVGSPNYLLRMSANSKLSKRAWERVMCHAREAFRLLLDRLHQNFIIDKDSFLQSLSLPDSSPSS